MIQVLLNGLIIGGIYALLSVGFALIYSSVRFHHLAYGTIGFFGAYLTYTFREFVGLNFFLSLFLASSIFAIVGLLFWKIFYEPLAKKNTSSVSMIVASFGLLIVFQNIIALIFGNSAKSLQIYDHLSQGYEFFGLSITLNQLIILISTVLVVIAFELLMTKTKLGFSIRAVGQNQSLAKTIGVKSEQVILYSFFLGTFISVFASSLVALEIGLRPVYGFILILKVIVACIIGGMGRIKGAMIGGLILGVVENFGIFFFGANWQDTVAFVLLIAFLLFKPRGVFE